MQKAKEIRENIENIIEVYFSDDKEIRNLFFKLHNTLFYWSYIKNSAPYDEDMYDIEKFEDDIFKSYNSWMKEYYTKEYLDLTEDKLVDKIGCNDDIKYLNELPEDLLDNDVEWWIDVCNDFDAEDYLIKD